MLPGAGVLKDDPGPGKVDRVVYCTAVMRQTCKRFGGSNPPPSAK
jgi:hypothetical protein